MRRSASVVGLGLMVGVIGALASNVTGCGASAPSMDPDPVAPFPSAPTPTESPTGSPDSCGLPPAVDTILKEHCQGCHGTERQYGAPNSLVTYDDLNQTGVDGKKIYERIQARIHQDVNPMPQPPNPRLTPDQMKVVDDWVAAGAPRSTESCGGQGGGLGPQELNCQPGERKVTIKPSVPYNVRSVFSETYTCVEADFPSTGKPVYITAIGPNLDKKEVIHHILLMQTFLPYSKLPLECAGVGDQQWKLIQQWAPGASNLILPPEASFPSTPSTHWIIQTHYNNTTGKATSDASGFDVCVSDTPRKYEAGVVALGSMAFVVPPRATYWTSCTVPVPPTLTGKVTFFQTSPHMHKLGYAMKTTIKPLLGGKETVLVDEKNFSFQNQQMFPVNIEAKTGDLLTTTCRWRNTTDWPVTWGESTSNEMCYNYTAYYPLIGLTGDLSLNWMLGAVQPICAHGIEGLGDAGAGDDAGTSSDASVTY